MDFSIAPEHQHFAASLHDMLASADGPAAARSAASGDRGPALKIWRSLADLGATALAVPAEYGGLDAHPAVLVLACEEIGHHAIPGPMAESLAATPQLLAGADVPDHDDFLGQLAAGSLIATLATPPVVKYAADTDMAGLVLLGEPAVARISTARTVRVMRSVDPARTVAEIAGD